MMKLVTFSKGQRQVAINPCEVSDVRPLLGNTEWTLITMKNRVEHAVQHGFEFVVGRLTDVGGAT